MSEVDKENMSKALDRINDIAEDALTQNDIPPEVEEALSQISSISRYKFDSVGQTTKAED